MECYCRYCREFVCGCSCYEYPLPSDPRAAFQLTPGELALESHNRVRTDLVLPVWMLPRRVASKEKNS